MFQTLNNQILHNLVCVGHPSSALLKLLRGKKIEVERVIFVCPHPDLASFVKRRLAHSVAFHIIPKMLNDQGSKSHYFTYTLPEWSSPLKPAGLNDFFPNLREVNTIEAEGVTLATLVETLKLADHQNNALVLNGNGHETSVLSSLQGGLRECFQWCVIRRTPDILYEGSDAFGAYEKLLAEYHYQVTDTCENLADSGAFPYAAFSFDSNQAQLAQLTASLTQENIDQQVLQQKNDALEQQVAELQKLVAQANQDKGQQTKLANERLKQIEQANQDKEQQTKLANERLKQIEQANQDKEQRQQTLFSEEMARAEAQIELIKDLLLRESAE